MAKALVSSGSRLTYAWSGKHARQSVVFPDCRGPVTATTGIRAAASRRVGSIVRWIMHKMQMAFTHDVSPRYS